MHGLGVETSGERRVATILLVRCGMCTAFRKRWTNTTTAHLDLGVCPPATVGCVSTAPRRPSVAAVAVTPSVSTSGKIRTVPNAPKTPHRGFRIPDDLYRAAQEIAAERGETLSDVVRAALERYVKRNRKR